MTRHTRLALIASAWLLLPGATETHAQHFPLESVDRLELHNVTAEPATLHGKKGLRLTLPEEVRQRVKRLESMMPEEREKSMTPEERARVRNGLPFLVGQLALVQKLEFSSGTIEVEIAGAPESGAGESARGFVGIAFRVQEDLQTYDAFYLRPTNGRAEDQERRNHSVQYISHPEWPWFRLRKETPGKYESYVDLVPGQWTKIRIEVDGEQARLYVHSNEHPTLIVNDVKSGADASGGVALWLEPGTVAHFRNLTVKPRQVGDTRQRVTATPSGSVRNSAGMQLMVAQENNQPTLRIVLPGRPTSDRAIEILFPEHVTVRPRGSAEGHQLYMFQPGQSGERPLWRRSGSFLEYERDLRDGVHLLARATLEDDGVRFRYELTNDSRVAYDMIYVPTDPRLTSIFHDVRLERTYVHHADGVDLLASETPRRLTIPLDQWLPARYLASFTWPVPAQRIERRDDGITYYNKSRAVDVPFIATVSTDKAWVIASFARTAGNVWSNPELTCQHVDPQTSLSPGQRATIELKMLVIRGSLDDALERAIRQRESLK
jgi:hypothetical protein